MKLIVTRGLPASGKTTKAREWVLADPIGRVRVNRDDLRQMVTDSHFVGGKEGTEKIIRKMRDKLISTALLAGKNVIVDDTGLESKTMRELHVLAWTHGAEFLVWDLCHVPMEQCIRRDIARILRNERGVGENVIRSMAQRAKLPPEGGVAPVWTPDTTVSRIERYEPNLSKPHAVIVDIDGTVALHTARSPYDYTRVLTDSPNLPVIRVLQALRLSSFAPQVIFLSGRPDSCREDTEKWLDEHVGFWDHLFMRPAGDARNDAVIKYELFHGFVAPRFNVLSVFDDRDRVVRLWRALGLSVFQVNDGDF